MLTRPPLASLAGMPTMPTLSWQGPSEPLPKAASAAARSAMLKPWFRLRMHGRLLGSAKAMRKSRMSSIARSRPCTDISVQFHVPGALAEIPLLVRGSCLPKRFRRSRGASRMSCTVMGDGQQCIGFQVNHLRQTRHAGHLVSYSD